MIPIESRRTRTLFFQGRVWRSVEGPQKNSGRVAEEPAGDIHPRRDSSYASGLPTITLSGEGVGTICSSSKPASA